MKEIFKISFLIVISYLIPILYFLFNSPNKFDYIFTSINSEIIEGEYLIGSLLSKDRIIKLKDNFPNAIKFCTLRHGINPTLNPKSNKKIIHNIGPLFMGSDRDWHLSIEYMDTILIFALNRYLFPLEEDMKCDENLLLRFNKEKHLFVSGGA